MNSRPSKRVALLLVGFLAAWHAHAQSVSTTVRKSDTGLGLVELVPGSNVTEYVVYGGASPYAFTTGTGLSTALSGDGSGPVFGGEYYATYFTWTGGDPGATGGAAGSSYGANMGGVIPLSTGYGTTPYSWVNLALTAPSSDFTLDFFVHDYYANADLDVALNGTRIDYFESIMSSSGSRDTDFMFRETVTGVQAGDTLTFTFSNLQNLGSSWANIDIFAASVNLELPSSISVLPTAELTSVPEPSTSAMLGAAALALLAVTLRGPRRA